jgi:hypothetical protein
MKLPYFSAGFLFGMLTLGTWMLTGTPAFGLETDTSPGSVVNATPTAVPLAPTPMPQPSTSLPSSDSPQGAAEGARLPTAGNGGYYAAATKQPDEALMLGGAFICILSLALLRSHARLAHEPASHRSPVYRKKH